jgi:hypothetical protein
MSAAMAASVERNLPVTATAVPHQPPQSILWAQIGSKAGADYQGDGLKVTETAEGARLHCVFQRLDGEATREGLWMTSTVTNQANDRFRVRAVVVGRHAAGGRASPRALTSASSSENKGLAGTLALPPTGTVTVEGQTVRFRRAGLVEECSVSMDGVRQDFVVAERPVGSGELEVRLEVTGAGVEAMGDGARLVLRQSGRKIAYSRLRATDAVGRELSVRMQVLGNDDGTELQRGPLLGLYSAAASHEPREQDGPLTPALSPSEGEREEPQQSQLLAIMVNDAEAVYPVRIDPTFSDANWISLGGVLGADQSVYAAAVDGSDILYIGGDFTMVGNTAASRIAQWNGSSWSALGAGMNSSVCALAVSGSTLYAGGYFTTAGGSAANYIAQWDGSSWSGLGSGMGGGTLGTYTQVRALAVSGGTLYAGGIFTMAGGKVVNYIAQWDGGSWSALGSGLSGQVDALAALGDTLYAGGYFRPGKGATNNIARWDGSNWSALGPGLGGPVNALAVSGGTLYAGGSFTTAGGSAANCIAQWDGSSWSALGSGMNNIVYALAVSGGTLYAGGWFTTAGGKVSAYAAGAVISPQLLLSQPQFTNHQFQFTLSGPAGSNAVIYANTNPAAGTWVSLATNPMHIGSAIFTDTQATNYGVRSYRALLMP